MKFLNPSVIALILLTVTSGSYSQESALGELPPLPNLNLGDPDTKPTRAEVRMRTKIAKLELEQEKAVRLAAEERSRQLRAENPSPPEQTIKRRPVSQKITVQNSLPANEDGITASGSRLQPFGEERAWKEMMEPTQEELLVDLPPLPDLRTPDQVTRKERYRDIMTNKADERKAEADADRELREVKARAIVNRPAGDPSNAMVIVESQRGSAVDGYSGSGLAPETTNESTLKPFNENSVYYQNNQLQYRGPEGGENTGGLFRIFKRSGSSD